MIEWALVRHFAVTAASAVPVLLSGPGSLELCVLTCAALLPALRGKNSIKARSCRIAVVVPAHDEELHITSCLRSLNEARGQDQDIDICVVADNCTDDTASLAARSGARVLVRANTMKCGKGFALDFAFKTLLQEQYEAFLVVDADTSVAGNFFTEMRVLLSTGADAVQCRYLVRNSTESIRTRLRSVAMRAFNVVRPRGRDRLGVSCGIYGNGFGVSRKTLEKVPYLASSVVEDLEYHLALIRSGRRVRFADRTEVCGEMPVGKAAADKQRTRWEGGRFRMIREKAPELLRDAIRGRTSAIEPLLDLLLLPLGFHATLLVCGAVSSWNPARIAALVGVAVLLLHLFATFVVGDASCRDLMALTAAPLYVLRKCISLPRLLRSSGRDATWVRTERISGEVSR